MWVERGVLSDWDKPALVDAGPVARPTVGDALAAAEGVAVVAVDVIAVTLVVVVVGVAATAVAVAVSTLEEAELDTSEGNLQLLGSAGFPTGWWGCWCGWGTLPVGVMAVGICRGTALDELGGAPAPGEEEELSPCWE